MQDADGADELVQAAPQCRLHGTYYLWSPIGVNAKGRQVTPGMFIHSFVRVISAIPPDPVGYT